MIYLKCISSFSAYNQNGSLNKRVNQGTYWIYLGVENDRHKLQKVYKNSNKITFVYVKKQSIKNNFKAVKESDVDV